MVGPLDYIFHLYILNGHHYPVHPASVVSQSFLGTWFIRSGFHGISSNRRPESPRNCGKWVGGLGIASPNTIPSRRRLHLLLSMETRALFHDPLQCSPPRHSRVYCIFFIDFFYEEPPCSSMRRNPIHYQSSFPGMDSADSSGWHLYPGESIDFDCLAAPDKRSNAKEMAEFFLCIHSDPFRFFLNLGDTALLEPGGFGFLHPYLCPCPVLLDI